MDSIWKDPDVFRPERWLEPLPPSEDLCNGWANLLAFSDGPRKCIGLRLGKRHSSILLPRDFMLTMGQLPSSTKYVAVESVKFLSVLNLCSQVILSYMVKRFAFSDANMDIKLKIASSLQAWVVGREDLGPCLPAHVELL